MRRSNARVAEAVDRPHINKEKKKMDNSIKLKFRPNQSLRSTNLFSRNQKQPHLTKSNIYIIGFLTFVFVSSCYLYFNSRNPVQKRYRIIIDGGSTGSRIHVFQYVIKDGAPVFDLSGKKGLASMRVSPGLSAFAEDPKGAGASVLELLEFARERIPGEKWGETEVRLMATAGLRMLDLSVQERILESCRNVLRTSGFAFRNDWASVISGSDEGVYAWVVANYALGTLGDDPQETTGIIELGGASAQVTFFSSAAIPPEFSQTVKFGNVSYSLYSHSLLEFGQNVAFDLIRWSMFAKGSNPESFGNKEPVDPCSPKGYKHNAMIGNYTPGSFVEMNEQSSVLHSSGNFSECRSASLTLLQKGKEDCTYDQCYIGSTFMPKLEGKFLATENFFHTSKFFGLSPRTFLSELMVAGKKFCEDDWSKLKRKYPTFKDEDLHRYCFSSAYIIALLHDSLGIALDDKRIRYANQVSDIPLDWALGAFISQIMSELDVGQLYPVKSILGVDSWTLAFVIFLLIGAAYFGSKWRNPPNVKTIYDLEKGKYIVTRIGRHS
ncbi:probable apyrase 6 isoform X2 [Cynara cardunculus var. scolymus]|uniref:probable apyrase 6 isoform X2 n=1 Tax=Cynara cardunculus var. scolymus TaxID=59895 RepID=UPI000D627022|nr:probable apyrase 6 isoform X2 [Cynara cardunculus var. scolymus]